MRSDFADGNVGCVGTALVVVAYIPQVRHLYVYSGDDHSGVQAIGER